MAAFPAVWPEMCIASQATPASALLRMLFKEGEEMMWAEGEAVLLPHVIDAYGRVVARPGFLSNTAVGLSSKSLRSRLNGDSKIAAAAGDDSSAAVRDKSVEKEKEVDTDDGEELEEETTPKSEGRESEVWLSSEPLGGLKIGERLVFREGDVKAGRTAALFRRDGCWVKGSWWRGRLSRSAQRCCAIRS